MSVMQGKRKREDLGATLSNEERIVLDIIHRKKEMGIWHGDMKRETKIPIPETVLKKSIKSLLSKALIKEVVNIQNKSRKLLMAVEFEPSKDITGGVWYTDGKLDTEFIRVLSQVCNNVIARQKVATRDGILKWIRNDGSAVFPGGVTVEQVEQILQVLVMDGKIQEVSDPGVGGVGYRVIKKFVQTHAMASIPCGVCPRINFCEPGGVVSPITCEYYKKWLDF